MNTCHINKLFGFDALEDAMQNGFVSRRTHPTEPLAILNYTARCQYERGAWNTVTRQCRGLVYHLETGHVLARPFPKFFNWGEPNAPTLDLDAMAYVTDKLDGSLGVLYPVRDGHAVATRGAFESEQAQHATALWRERYTYVPVPDDWTLLFEIIYPDNRIVVDYGQFDDLVLLGAVEISTGQSVLPHHVSGWNGPTADFMGERTIREALTLSPRPNAEGIVLHVVDANERVKVKQEDYVALHRIIMGLNERTVWEHLCEGKPVRELLNALPDEFHTWVSEVAARLVATVERDAAETEHAYSAILAALPEGYARKDFAMKAKEHRLNWALFNRHDGKDYRPRLWQNAKPAPNWPRGVSHTEDTA